MRFTVEVEGVPVEKHEPISGEVFTFQPLQVYGDWATDGPLEMRRVIVRGRILGFPSEHYLSRDYVLHLPPDPENAIWPLAPQWVFEALKEAGVEY